MICFPDGSQEFCELVICQVNENSYIDIPRGKTNSSLAFPIEDRDTKLPYVEARLLRFQTRLKPTQNPCQCQGYSLAGLS